MNRGASARLALLVLIGVLAGSGLMTLPHVLVPSSQLNLPKADSGNNSTSAYSPGVRSNSSGSMTTRSGLNTTVANPSSVTSQGNITRITLTNSTTKIITTTTKPLEGRITLAALSLLVSLLVVPALALSFLTMTWTARRERKRLSEYSRRLFDSE